MFGVDCINFILRKLLWKVTQTLVRSQFFNKNPFICATNRYIFSLEIGKSYKQVYGPFLFKIEQEIEPLFEKCVMQFFLI